MEVDGGELVFEKTHQVVKGFALLTTTGKAVGSRIMIESPKLRQVTDSISFEEAIEMRRPCPASASVFSEDDKERVFLDACLDLHNNDGVEAVSAAL